MNKKDLKQGAIIETEYGAQYILVDKIFINLETGCYLDSTDYDDDLVSLLGAPIISKVFIPERTHEGYKNYIDKNLKWTWERKNDIQFNIGDIVKGNFYDRTKGRIGKIVEKVNNRYLVEYDEYFEGDNGSFLNKKYARPTNNYWWEWNTALELVRAFTQHEVEQTPQHEFKVGDKVKILWDKTFYNHKYYENVGVIYSIDAPYISVNHFSKGNPQFELEFIINQLELVKEPTPKFKVGDKVKILSNVEDFDNEHRKSFIGKTGTIVKIRDYAMPYLVYLGEKFDGHDGYTGYSESNNNNWWFYENNLELVKEPTPEFKVGDKVKILDNVDNFNNEHRKSFIGKIGTIIKKNGFFRPYLVYLGKDFDGHNGITQSNENNWWFYENNLELVKEPTPELKVDDVVNTPLGVGKIVEVIGKFYLVYLGMHFKGHDFFGSQPNNNNWTFKKEELSHIGDY